MNEIYYEKIVITTCNYSIFNTKWFFFCIQDIGNLAPRKPDWDLKRDVSKKIEKLERRTQKSIAELIIERLKQNDDDLSTDKSV